MLPVQQWLDEDDSLHEETLRQRILDELTAIYDDKSGRPGPSRCGASKEVMLFRRSTRIGRTTWRHGLPAPGYPPARLCAEEPQAGIQA